MRMGKKINESFLDFMADRNLRKTVQRDEILTEVLNYKGHITAEDLYLRLKAKNSRIGFATVCRNLRLLSEAGILGEIKVGLDKTRYEIKLTKGHHDHLICIRCGELIEVFSREIERLQNDLAAQNEFKVIRHKLEIYGICKMCQKKGREE